MFSKKMLVIALTSLAIVSASARAECARPSSTKQGEISSYVMKKYGIGPTSGLMLAGISQEGADCFWKLRYTTTTPRREITLYLSPDGEHLSPAVYDMRLDPLLEAKQKNLEMVKVLTAGSPMATGPVSAPVTIVEFSDFECPYCKRMTDVLEKDVLPSAGNNVRLVFRSFPLPIHPWAKAAAIVAQCAGLQSSEAFWAMHDYFFQNQQMLKVDSVKEQSLQFAAANISGINQQQLQTCVDRDLGLGPVMQDQDLGQKLGVHATPTFFVNGVRFDGAHTAEEMRVIIQKASAGELITSTERISLQEPTINVVARANSIANQCAPASR